MPKYSPKAVKSIEDVIAADPTPADLYRQVNEGVAAEFLDISTRQLQKFRREGGGPKFIKMGEKCVRYRVLDLIRFQEECIAENNIVPLSAA